jgi:hypothetical protein
LFLWKRNMAIETAKLAKQYIGSATVGGLLSIPVKGLTKLTDNVHTSQVV